MATTRRDTTKKTRISRLKIARIECAALFIVLVLIGLAIGLIIGKVTTKPQIEYKTETVYETIEVPTYEEDALPADYEVYYFDVPLSHNLQKYIYEICADENVPVAMIMAIIDHESNFDPETVSDTNDYGLMQINECNHSLLAESYRTADMLNPYQNVFCGVKIIASYYEQYGDWSKALMAYNMGDYGANKAWANGIDSSSYSKAIMNLYEEYEEELENATSSDNE